MSPYTDRGLPLRYQVCLACGAAQTLQRFACAGCGHEQLAWREASGRGTVQAFSLVSRAPSEEFRPLLPYALVLVALEEGPRVMAHGQTDLRIGQAVRAQGFEHAGRAMVRFVAA